MRTIRRDVAEGPFPPTYHLCRCRSELQSDRDCIGVNESADCNSDGKTDERQADDVVADDELAAVDC